MFFYIFEENSLLKSHSNSLYVVLEACDFIRNERAFKGCFFAMFSIFFNIFRLIACMFRDFLVYS